MAALAFSACTEELNNDNINGGKTVTVHFGTENTDPASTKATLTPDAGETAFQAAWEKGDEISVYYINDKEVENDFQNGIVPATWNGNSFSAELPEYTGEWDYRAAYPVPDAVDNHVDFGPNRTQKGNAYNSLYDIMVGKATAAHAAAGKDDSGNDIVFQMDRQTAIAYFHFTSDLDEAVTSATLTVGGEGAAIASNYAFVSDFAWAPTKDCQSITITFPEETPNAQDFQLWFNVLPTTYTKMTLIVETATKTFTISNTKGGSYTAGKLYKVKKENISWAGKGGSDTPSTVTDVITAAGLTATSSSYADFSNKTFSSSAVYAGNSAVSTSSHIQLRSKNSNSGIVTTTSGGKVRKITIVWSKDNTADRTLDVYGKNTPYESAANLYASKNADQGTKLGSLNSTDKDTELTITGDYSYVGVRSNDNALQLESISIEWESGSSEPAPDTYSVSCASVTGGTLSASPVKAEAGAEVTLTATPYAGYAFNNDWTVKDANEAEIPVTDGKFTMPAKDVTVSGSFRKVDYTITKATCEGGSFTVTKNGVEVTKAQIDETITLTASAEEGYEFDSWSVTNETTSKSLYVNENTFTMPGANVTVSANFLKADEVPVYASVADLIAAGTPTSKGVYVTVTLSNEEITKFFTTSTKARRGVYFTVGTQEIELFGDIACPEEWVAGGWVSGTLAKCKWMIYNGTWELCPADWTELTYAAPCETPDITLDGAVATITCATEGATIRYTLDKTDPVETSDVYTDAVTLTDGQTIKAKAFLTGHKPSEIASKTYSSTGGETTYSFDITVSSFSNKSWSSYATKTATITGSDNKTYSITGENMAYNADYIQIRSSKNSKIYNTTSIRKIRSIVISDKTKATFTVKSGSSQNTCNTSVSAESDNRTFNFTGDASYFTIEVGNTTIANVTKITVTYE